MTTTIEKPVVRGAASLRRELDWAKIYDEYRDAMHAVAVRGISGVAHPDFEAADVVNQAFVEVMSDPPPDVRSWRSLLLDATVRCALACVEAAEQRVYLDDDESALVEPNDIAEIAMRRVRADEIRTRMLRVMDYMTTRQQQITRLRLFEGRSVGEIAAQMNTSSSNVSQIVIRCLTKLRPVLTQLDEIESHDVEGVRPARKVG